MGTKSWWLGVSILANVVCLALLAAERLPSWRANHSGSSPVMPFEALDLSSEQRGVFEAEKGRFHAELSKSQQAIEAGQAEMIRLLAMPVPDRPAIMAQQQEILSLQGVLQSTVLAHLLTVSEPLTPEQRARFFGLLRQRLAQPPGKLPSGCY